MGNKTIYCDLLTSLLEWLFIYKQLQLIYLYSQTPNLELKK